MSESEIHALPPLSARSNRMNPEDRKVMEMARDAVGSALEDAYSRSGLVCCNRPGYDCCGSPRPEWSETDAKIMNVLGPIHRAIEERLQADEKFVPSICKGVPDPRCNYLSACDQICNKCGRKHEPQLFGGNLVTLAKEVADELNAREEG